MIDGLQDKANRSVLPSRQRHKINSKIAKTTTALVTLSCTTATTTTRLSLFVSRWNFSPVDLFNLALAKLTILAMPFLPPTPKKGRKWSHLTHLGVLLTKQQTTLAVLRVNIV
jgi:hypothetical protein